MFDLVDSIRDLCCTNCLLCCFSPPAPHETRSSSYYDAAPIPPQRGKISGSKPSPNGTIQGSSGSGMVNGGAPQLGGLFAGGMPKLRPTGRGRNNADSTDSGPSLRPPVPGGAPPQLPLGKKPSAPPTPPSSAKPTHQPSQTYLNHNAANDHSPSNGYLPPSPKPSSKSSPAPPPPPSNRKPSTSDRGRVPYMDIPPPSSKPAPPKPPTELSSSTQNEERHPPLPMKPAFKVRPEPGYRGAPPRPPSFTKPNLPPKSPDLKPSGLEPRRTSIDRSVSLREPQRPPLTQTRVGTSAESPAAPFRVNTNHREAPPVPSSRPALSKTVGRAAGSKLMPALRPPSEKPPKPPSRPVVAAPPPPSQPPPPPPPSHKGAGSSTPLPGGKGDVPLPPIPQSAVPPTPPERNESTRATYNKQPDDFESKFSNLFKSRHQLPHPLTYDNVPKIYPSKNNALPFFLHQSYLDLHAMGQNEAKNQRRAPLPPTSNNNNSASSQQSSTNPPPPPHASSKPSPPHGHNTSTSSFLHSMGGNNPPPPPPHAPLHLQMDRKFYGTEASQC